MHRDRVTKKTNLLSSVKFLALATVILLASCSYLDIAAYYEIEVGPGKYAIVKFDPAINTMKVLYNGQVINIGKVGDKYDEPITIIQNGGNIYLVKIYNGNSPDSYKFKFFKQDSNKFNEIKPSSFPRNIAIANFHSSMHGQELDKNGNVIRDHRKVELERDINSYEFQRSLTAHLWYHLETGMRYYDIISKNTIEKEFLQSYISKYNPVKLKMKKPQKLSKEYEGF